MRLQILQYITILYKIEKKNSLKETMEQCGALIDFIVAGQLNIHTRDKLCCNAFGGH